MLKHEERLKGVNESLCRVVRLAAGKVAANITVSEGLRTKERQAQLFKEGRSKTMNSKHLTGRTVDLYPLKADGSIDWNGFSSLVSAMKKAAAELGVKITCGYDWGWDKPHFELS
jgi:peptidoglycan L-alanyl-D-glutamate endopeptidase CwlK